MTNQEQNQGVILPIPADFPVEWENEEEATYLWRWDSIHSPLPSSPMSVSLGDDRAARQANLNPSSNSPKSSFRRQINGYTYSANLPSETTYEDRQRKQDEVNESIATLRHRWDTEIQPTIVTELGNLKSIDLGSLSDAELLDQLDEFLDLTVKHWKFHNQVVGPTHTAVHQLATLYREIMGDVPEDEPYKLIRGLDNKSLETDQAIQALAALARESDELSKSFADNDDPNQILSVLASTEEGRGFSEKLNEFLEVYGLRPTGFDALFPSWLEDPSFVILNIKSYIQFSPTDFSAKQTALSAEAESCRQLVLRKIGDNADLIDNFLLRLKHARELWPLKEDHAFYIDQGSSACVRILLAEVGRRISGQGIIHSAEEVYYLTLDEALTALTNPIPDNHSELVTERRNLRDAQIKVVPPAFLGTLPADGSSGMAPEFQTMMSPVPDANAEADESALRGIGGSAGSATGPAKVVRSPEEFGKIQPGDILVCTSTSPTWTPLFGTIRALVSDSGGVLSHTAIVAREYGLPAVVGVNIGTSRISDGQIITVDGDSGVAFLR
ncbi:MAG: PEP-utilizing enzyme [SAR202 cluster bacterium]|nr:PEP-utilizing enzyme [SAR202 cluster bacterium]